jgi:hypothetical protein
MPFPRPVRAASKSYACRAAGATRAGAIPQMVPGAGATPQDRALQPERGPAVRAGIVAELRAYRPVRRWRSEGAGFDARCPFTT